MENNPATSRQTPPTKGKERVLDAVIEDLKARAEMGNAKYGTYLMTFNGREPVWDAMQEGLDLLMYLKQHTMQQEELYLELEGLRRYLLSLMLGDGREVVKGVALGKVNAMLVKYFPSKQESNG